jgi:hypothetical protein
MGRRILHAGLVATPLTTGAACGSSGPSLPVVPPGTPAVGSFSLVEFRYHSDAEWSYAPARHRRRGNGEG